MGTNRQIKSEDCQIATKKTMTGKYQGVVVYEGEQIHRTKQSFKTRELAVAFTRRVLEIAPIIAVNEAK